MPADPTGADDTGARALRGLKHFASELCFTLRGALDAGCTAKELKAAAKKHPITRDPEGGSDPVFLANINSAIPLAIDYMAANKNAGAVVWKDDGRWDWATPTEGERNA